jgi:hypothetical protein
LGNEADFLGRNVEGKAVFSYSMFGMGNNGALARADAKWTAAIFDAHMLPGLSQGNERPDFHVRR